MTWLLPLDFASPSVAASVSLLMSMRQPVSFCGQTPILALFADGERELPVGNDHDHPGARRRLPAGWCRWPCGLSVADELADVVRPFDRVDFPAHQFVDDLDARAQADARADRVHARLAGGHCLERWPGSRAILISTVPL